jgi:hypothetical protein
LDKFFAKHSADCCFGRKPALRLKNVHTDAGDGKVRYGLSEFRYKVPRLRAGVALGSWFGEYAASKKNFFEGNARIFSFYFA